MKFDILVEYPIATHGAKWMTIDDKDFSELRSPDNANKFVMITDLAAKPSAKHWLKPNRVVIVDESTTQ